jgi:hypothetical protein
MTAAPRPIKPDSSLPSLAGYGFQEPNYTQTPNEVFAALPWLNEGELKTLLVIVRYTLGYHRTICDASYEDLAVATLISRRKVIDICKRLADAGLITRVQRFPKCRWRLNITQGDIRIQPGQPTQPRQDSQQPHLL